MKTEVHTFVLHVISSTLHRKNEGILENRKGCLSCFDWFAKFDEKISSVLKNYMRVSLPTRKRSVLLSFYVKKKEKKEANQEGQLYTVNTEMNSQCV